MPKTLVAVITALATVITGWAPTTSLLNDIADAILILVGAHTALPGNPLINAVAKFLNNMPAEYSAVIGGGVGILGSEPVEVSGEHDEVMIFAVRKYMNSAPPEGSFAAYFKQTEGT